MDLTTIWLLLSVPCILVQTGDGYEERETSSSKEQMQLYLHRTLTDREKRARLPFSAAWKELIKTARPFKWQNTDGVDIKLYTKVGPLRDALEDFYSLGPRTVRMSDRGVSGRVENQIIRLLVPSKDGSGPARPVLSVLDSDEARLYYGVSNDNRVPRLITYQESPAETKALLRKWNRQFSRQ